MHRNIVCISILTFILLLNTPSNSVCAEITAQEQPDKYGIEQNEGTSKDANNTVIEGSKIKAAAEYNEKKESLTSEQLNTEKQKPDKIIENIKGRNTGIELSEEIPNTQLNDIPDEQTTGNNITNSENLKNQEENSPVIYNNTKNWIQEPSTKNPLTTIDKRKYIRYNTIRLPKPVILKTTRSTEELIDISRGGVALKHNNTLFVGDIIPVQITYKDTKINTNIRIVFVNQTRAGAEFVEEDKTIENQLMYLNIQIEADNHMIATKLSQ